MSVLSTIIVSLVILIISQIVTHLYIAGATRDGKLQLTRNESIAKRLGGIFTWPFLLLILFIHIREYPRFFLVACASWLGGVLLIAFYYYFQADANFVKSVGLEILVTMMWWLIVYLIGGLIEGFRNGTLFED